MVVSAASAASMPTSNGSLSRALSVQPCRMRKCTQNVNCPKPSLSGYAAAVDLHSAGHRRRRFSQVGHRLSSTIGWRISHQGVVDQGKSLCGRYLRAKLRSCAAVHKKLGLQRLKSVSNLARGSFVAEVAARLRQLAAELERLHPQLFGSVTENVGLHALPSETVVQNLFQALAGELFRADITWGRVVALYAVAGALAVDCVKLGRPEFVLGLVQSMGAFMERDLGAWIVQQGGWAALLSRFKKSSGLRTMETLGFVVFLFIVLLLVYWIS